MERPPARLPRDFLVSWTERVLVRAGLDVADARTCADAFVLQEMRGAGHHGLARLPALLDELRSGVVNSRARRRIVSRQGGTAVLDAGSGPGIAACQQAMQVSIEAARLHHVGFTVVRNSSHFLAGAPYCLAAAAAGMIGIATTNTPSSMAYPGLHTPTLGNGPFAYAVPTAEGFPLVFDAAMTASGGQLIELAEGHEMLPEYLAGFDSAKRPTRDPGAILEGGATLPIGMHKGAGIVLLLELLTGVLGGGAYLHGDTAGPDRIGPPSQCLLAIDVEAFMPLMDFQARVQAYIREIKATADAEGSTVFLPGERAHRRYEEGLKEGVPVSDDLAATLRRVAEAFGVPLDGVSQLPPRL